MRQNLVLFLIEMLPRRTQNLNPFAFSPTLVAKRSIQITIIVTVGKLKYLPSGSLERARNRGTLKFSSLKIQQKLLAHFANVVLSDIPKVFCFIILVFSVHSTVT